MLIDYHVKHALDSPHGVYAEIIEVATNHLLHLTPLRPRERLVLLDVLAYVGRWSSERHLSPGNRTGGENGNYAAACAF